jgi:GMP synthase (glutamine-hydrolysing)
MANVLLIQHLATSHTGLVGEWLVRHGHTIAVCRPLLQERLPETERFDGAIIFGGPQSANDPCPHLAQELHWLERALFQRQRLLGICLGAQLMAKALGARVAPHSQDQVECGYAWIDPGLPNPWIEQTRAVYHWHQEGFSLPEGATLAARGRGDFPTQAFCRDRALGVQFHPEATPAIMARWIERDAADLKRPGACAASAHWHGHDQHGLANARWLDLTLDRWLRQPEI